MIDLSSPKMQSRFRLMQRTSIVSGVLMCIITATCIALAIWATTLGPRADMSWSEIIFFILIAIICAYFVFMLVWEIVVRRRYRTDMRVYIAENMESVRPLLDLNSDARFEIFLAGDKLNVMREGKAEVLQLDLTPVKAYAGVCGNIVRFVRQYIFDYFYAQSLAGNAPANVALSDAVRKKPKAYVMIDNGTPVLPLSHKLKNLFKK